MPSLDHRMLMEQQNNYVPIIHLLPTSFIYRIYGRKELIQAAGIWNFERYIVQYLASMLKMIANRGFID